MAKIAIVFALLLLLPHAALALAVSPPSYDYGYAPGEKNTFAFNIRNDGSASYINATARGPFSNVIKISNDYFFLRGGESKSVTIELVVPETKSPGKHVTEVVFSQVAPKRYGRPQELTATVAVVGLLRTFVPYRQKYAEASLSIGNVRRVEKAYFSVSLANYGLESISKATGTIKVFDEKNSISASAPLTELLNVGSLGTGAMYAELDTSGLSLGKYFATADVYYDSIKASDTEEFKITDLQLEIIGISAPDITEGQLAKITTTVQSKWSEEVGAFAQIYVKDTGGAVIAEATTPTMKIPAFGTGKLVAYINTNNVPAGAYGLDIIVNYAGKEERMEAKFNVLEKAAAFKSGNNLAYIALIVIIALLIILLLKKQKNAK